MKKDNYVKEVDLCHTASLFFVSNINVVGQLLIGALCIISFQISYTLYLS